MIGLLCAVASAAQAQILRLPAAACVELGDSADGFEAAWPSWPSHGSGGVAGSGVRSIAIPGFETLPAYAQRTYFWFVPEQAPAGPMPLVVALHGTAGSPANAYNEARIVRDLTLTALASGPVRERNVCIDAGIEEDPQGITVP